jgi:hypothetical protein
MKLSDLTINKDIYVGLLTEIQKNELQGQLYTLDSYFNPIQDVNNNWIISIEEIEFCTNEDFFWVRDLEMIIYEPKPIPPFEL